MFARNLRLFYLYLVSFIALLTAVFALYGSATAIMNLIFTSGDKSYFYRHLFNVCAFWIVALPVYFFHWGAIKKGNKPKIADQAEVISKWE